MTHQTLMNDNSLIRRVENDFIHIAALNQYDYCPLRCYYMFVCHEFADNVHTVEGTIMHERVHSDEETRRGELHQIRGVHLYSERYGLTGKADLIEEKDGCIYPVEYKKGKRGDWRNDKLQLCAQALCIEEALEREGRPQRIEFGYIFYGATGRREKVMFDDEIRAMTIETISGVRELITTRRKPVIEYSNRCNGCSIRGICLPRETDKLKKACRNLQMKSLQK